MEQLDKQDKLNEVWKTIEGYNSKYQVSNLGRVKNTETGKILKTYKDKDGYITTAISYKGKTKHYLIHRLIAKAFIPNPENKPHINHINTIKDDNRIENLEWVTPKENNNNPLTRKHLSTAMKIYGSMLGKKGKLCPNSKIVLELNREDNNKIDRLWFSTMDIERERGIVNQKVSDICKGKRRRTPEYNFMYVEDYLADWFDKEILS